VCSVAIEVVDKGELVSISECITLESLCEAVKRSGEHHGAVADLFLSARQTESMHLYGALCKTFFVGDIAVFGKVDVLEGSDDEADVLGENFRYAGEACCLPGRV
jgi:hypothetical protein